MNVVEWQRIDVTADKPYPVLLGAPLEELGNYLNSRVTDLEHILVFAHQKVADIYAERLMMGLQQYRVDLLIVPAGEEEKSLERLKELTTEAVRCGADRKTLVIALGGGVIGDLVGFFASVFMRGIRFIQVPTTLLAQVDSSIGGKVAVNHPTGKNLIGSFYPPFAVWSDFSTLNSLPWSEVENGLAESIKHALIAEPDLFDFFERNEDSIKSRDPQVWREMVTRSSAVKVRIVSHDETEQGVRALLNLGHSFGHAIEAELGYRGITHGHAVNIGVVAAAYLSYAKGFMTLSEVERIKAVSHAYGLPIQVKGLTAQVLLQRMAADKKNFGGRKVLILPKGIGQAFISKECTDVEIIKAWEAVIS